MQVSVIPADQAIVIDGVALVFDYQPLLPGLRAIQWNGTSGTMEFATGPQQYFDNKILVQPYIDAYNAEAARIAAAAAAS